MLPLPCAFTLWDPHLQSPTDTQGSGPFLGALVPSPRAKANIFSGLRECPANCEHGPLGPCSHACRPRMMTTTTKHFFHARCP